MLRLAACVFTISIFQIAIQQSSQAIIPQSDGSKTETATPTDGYVSIPDNTTEGQGFKDHQTTASSVIKSPEDPFAFFDDDVLNDSLKYEDTEETSELDDSESSATPNYMQILSGKLLVPALSAHAKISDAWSNGVQGVQSVGRRAQDMSRDTVNFLRNGIMKLFMSR